MVTMEIAKSVKHKQATEPPAHPKKKKKKERSQPNFFLFFAHFMKTSLL